MTERQFDRLPRFQISRGISLENFFFVPIGEENKNSREIRIEISARESLSDSSPLLFVHSLIHYFLSFSFLLFTRSFFHSFPPLSLSLERIPLSLSLRQTPDKSRNGCHIDLCRNQSWLDRNQPLTAFERFAPLQFKRFDYVSENRGQHIPFQLNFPIVYRL